MTVGLVATMMLHNLMLLYFLAGLGQHAHGGEIINGKKAPGNSMLYMASVQNNRGHVCGGFLISEDFVVTAAHCDKPNPTSVVLGTHNLKKIDDDKMRYNVTRCKHPNFKNAGSGNDIMLLKLTKPVRLDNKVQTIQLPRPNMKVKAKTKCSVAGWGFTESGGKPVDVLQEAEVSVVDLKQCRDEWKSVRVDLPKNIMCAGGYEEKEGFCQGDSGGPLVHNGMAIGVVSFNMKRNCDYPNVPNIYADISKYLPWIKKILKQKRC